MTTQDHITNILFTADWTGNDAQRHALKAAADHMVELQARAEKAEARHKAAVQDNNTLLCRVREQESRVKELELLRSEAVHACNCVVLAKGHDPDASAYTACEEVVIKQAVEAYRGFVPPTDEEAAEMEPPFGGFIPDPEVAVKKEADK